MKKELVAIVLAGGSGSRFWPLKTNKILFPFFGKPLFHYSVLEALPKRVTRTIIVASEDNKNVLSSVRMPVPSQVVVQDKPKGMADAVLTARDLVGDASLLIVNGDDINNPRTYDSVLSQAESGGAFGVIPAWKTESYQPLGYLVTDGGRVTRIVEKPGAGNEPSNLIYMVGYFVEDSNVYFRAMEESLTGDDAHERALSAMMEENRFESLAYSGGFATLKYPWHVLDVMDELFPRLTPHTSNTVQLKENVHIEGPVVLEDNIRIFENTKIIGPCYIGRNTIIGNNCMVRQSHIGENCVVGFNTDMTRSYIGDNCWFHSNYIGDSVLEHDISLGAGSVLANLRLDEKPIHSIIKGERTDTGRSKHGAVIGSHVRIGVNASIMPGVKVGSGSYIGAGVVVSKDVPEDTYCMVQAGLEFRKNHSGHGPSRETFRKKI